MTAVSDRVSSIVFDDASVSMNATSALARLHGEPIFALPTDLYIPPAALHLFLSEFEGPLDLLLYLIRKQGFDIFDIPVAQVTMQYMQYIEHIKSHHLELAADYLLMAATLIEIKSRLLLPRPQVTPDCSVEDPRQALVEKLIEYERIKRVAALLDARHRVGRDMFTTIVKLGAVSPQLLPHVIPNELKIAFERIVERMKLQQKHHITREVLSVRAFMSSILKYITQSDRSSVILFTHLCDIKSESVHKNAAIVVVNFIAILELTREGLLMITQPQLFDAIEVSLPSFMEKSVV